MNYVQICFLVLSFVSCTRQVDNATEEVDTDTTTLFLIKDEQTIAKLNTFNRIEEYTLIDDELQMKFVLDSQRINISAYDLSNNLIWRTDPWLDNKLIAVFVKRPLLVDFFFAPNDKENIDISYNSKQFGKVDRRTGKFHYIGSD